MAKENKYTEVAGTGKISINKANMSRCLYKYGYEKKDIKVLVGYASLGALDAALKDWEKERELTSPVYFDKKEQELIEKIKKKVLAFYKEESTKTVDKSVKASVLVGNGNGIGIGNGTGTGNKKPTANKKYKSLTIRKEELAKEVEELQAKKEGKIPNKIKETVKAVKNNPTPISNKEIEKEVTKYEKKNVEISSKSNGKVISLDQIASNYQIDPKYMARLEVLLTEPDVGDTCSVCDNQGWLLAPTNKGLKRITCLKCLGHKVRKKEASFVSEEIKKWIKNPMYRDNRFDFEKFNEGILLPVSERKYSFEKYVNFMNSIMDGLESDLLPRKSYYVVAPDNYGKKWFAYECMKLLVETGHEVGGLVDIADIKQAIEKEDYQKAKGYLVGDVIFVTLSNMGAGYFGYAVKYVLDYASKYGKPVFLFTRVQANTWVSSDKASMGIVYNHTKDYEFDKLEQVGLTGVEYSLAYNYMINESNTSIKYKEKRNVNNNYNKNTQKNTEK